MTPLLWYALAVVVGGAAAAQTAHDHTPHDASRARVARLRVFHALVWAGMCYAFLFDFGRVPWVKEELLWSMWLLVFVVQQAALMLWRWLDGRVSRHVQPV